MLILGVWADPETSYIVTFIKFFSLKYDRIPILGVKQLLESKIFYYLLNGIERRIELERLCDDNARSQRAAYLNGTYY